MKETVPTTKHSNLQGKKIFKNNTSDHSLFL